MAMKSDAGITWRESITPSVMTASAFGGRNEVSASMMSAIVSMLFCHLFGNNLLTNRIRRDIQQQHGLLCNFGEHRRGSLRTPDGGGRPFEPDVDHKLGRIHRSPTDKRSIGLG